jgi:hypothetical protein
MSKSPLCALAAFLMLPFTSVAQNVAITEFMASNSNTIDDEDGTASDWIEITNLDSSAVNLEGWFLTDDAALLQKWIFPSTLLTSGQSIVVFASDKNRNDAASELHTNFKLTSNGEYLALVKPDGTTIASDFAPSYPPQVDDLSYGITTNSAQTTLVAPGAPVKFTIPANADDDVDEGLNPNSFISLTFDDNSWTNGTTGIGYATGTPDDYDALIGTDIQSVLFSQSPARTSVYIRIPFTVANAGAVTALTLRMKYDDGFIAYLNGVPEPVAESNAPAQPAYNSTGVNHQDSAAIIYEDFTLSPGDLINGTNYLCIHGLNQSSSSSDALFLPEFIASVLSAGGQEVYFNAPTPGEENSTGTQNPGPLIRSVTNNVAPLTVNTTGASVVANSVAEFSGTQGQDSWYYGTHNGGDTYTPSTSFVQIPGGAGSGAWDGTTQLWDGTSWKFSASGAPWTQITSNTVHPNDSTPGPEHATVRRWVSDVTGLHTIAGSFNNGSVNGDGTTGRVFHNNTEIFAEVSDGDVKDFSLERVLAPGDTIDFLVDTGPADQDGSDSTNQSSTITQGSVSNSSVTLPIEAKVIPSFNPIDSVTLYYRVMYGAEVALLMNDAGTDGDTLAGDGTYTAIIATDDLAAGQMLRWRVVATDTISNTTVDPIFPDPLDSPEYHGTIAADPTTVSSLLPILHWFTSSPGGVETVSGARGSVYYLDQFYDNIQADRHGQSTGGFPKKSFDFDFNKGDRFEYKAGERRVKDLNLITNWADKSKTRNTMGYEMMRLAGHPAHFSFPVRVQQNGAFFSVADLVEDGDDRYLERAGLDPNGVLFKMYNTLNSSTSGVSRKTRKEEDNSDLQALINGLNLGTAAKLTYSYDNVNIPGTINYLAALALTNNRDHGHKNYYLYRDTEGTGEWRPLVWDQDLCLGRNWVGGPAYFDDTFTNNNLTLGAGNVMKTLIFNNSELDQMFQRRVRTLMDRFYGPPATPVTYIADRVDEITALIDPTNDDPLTGSDDADLDRQKWGTWGNGNAMRAAVDRIKNEYLPTKRTQLYGLNSVPAAQAAAPTINISTVEFNPASNGASPNQDGEYIILTNPNNTAVDVSDWTLSGGISMTIPPGTVIRANDILHIGKNAVGFRSRAVSPKAGENRFLVSGYSGQLSARGETITLSNELATVIDTETYTGVPTAGQQWLRVSKILYAPLDPTPAELSALPAISASDFEYIELVNTRPAALDISGAMFVEGVDFTFPANTVLQSSQRILIVANIAAFELRFGTGKPVAGAYTGKLNNDGEKLQIHDAVGENILEFSYNDIWYPPTDDNGHALVVLDPATTPVTDFDLPENWGISLDIGGDPGTAPTGVATTYEIWKAENFTEAELANPAISGDTIDLDNDGWNTLLEYALEGDPDRPDSGDGYQASMTDTSGSDYLTLTFRKVKAAIDVTYTVETGSTLADWAPTSIQTATPVDNNDGTETISIRDAIPQATSNHRFIRLKVTVGL